MPAAISVRTVLPLPLTPKNRSIIAFSRKPDIAPNSAKFAGYHLFMHRRNVPAANGDFFGRELRAEFSVDNRLVAPRALAGGQQGVGEPADGLGGHRVAPKWDDSVCPPSYLQEWATPTTHRTFASVD